MGIDVAVKSLSVVTGGVSVIAALMLASPQALADPAAPAPPPAPPAQPVAGDAAPVAADGAPPAEGVPHLLSPENLPPGTSDDPVAPESRGVNYLRDLWHAVQTQEVSGKDALLLLTQRPLDPNATPPPGLAPNPTPPKPAAPAPAPEGSPPPALPEAPPAPPPAPGPEPLMPFLP